MCADGKLLNPAFSTVAALRLLQKKQIQKADCADGVWEELQDVFTTGLQVRWVVVSSYMAWVVQMEGVEARAEVRVKPHLVDSALNLATLIERMGHDLAIAEYKANIKGQIGVRRANDAIWVLRSQGLAFPCGGFGFMAPVAACFPSHFRLPSISVSVSPLASPTQPLPPSVTFLASSAAKHSTACFAFNMRARARVVVCLRRRVAVGMRPCVSPSAQSSCALACAWGGAQERTAGGVRVHQLLAAEGPLRRGQSLQGGFLDLTGVQ